MFLKQLEFLDLPIANIGIFSPAIFAAAKTVMLSLLCLPPEEFVSSFIFYPKSSACRIYQKNIKKVTRTC